MRILYMGNNWTGWQILKWLVEQHEDIVGLVIHPQNKSKYRDEIIHAIELDPSCVFDGSRINESDTRSSIQALQPSLGISVFFGYILSKELLDLFSEGCINVHPSFLPYNRGVYPNVWSIIDGTPGGVTLHYMDAGIDSGDLIVQKQILIEPIDTGKSLYNKLESACLELFKDMWPIIRKGDVPRIPQKKLDGSYHSLNDVELIDKIELDRTYKARNLIDIIRSRTFSPYLGAYFMAGDRKVYMRMQLYFEDDLEKGI